MWDTQWASRHPPPIYPHHFLACRSPRSAAQSQCISPPHHGHNQDQRGEPAPLTASPQSPPKCCSGWVVSVQPQLLKRPFLPRKTSPAKLLSSYWLSTCQSALRTSLNQLQECDVLLQEGQALRKHEEPPAPADSQLFHSEIALWNFFVSLTSHYKCPVTQIWLAESWADARLEGTTALPLW